MKRIKPIKSFTLVEVMIVVGILALLAAIAIPNLLRSRINANDASAQATLKSIANALENYAIINGVYPSTTTALIGVNPPYLNQDYFTGIHSGFTYSHSFASYSYTVIATPVNTNSGTGSFTVTTGAVISSN